MPAPRQTPANRGPAAAAENRRALLAAARELFAEEGYQVPFSAIARRAGVGQASLYRHFPTKADLAVALFDENLGTLDGLDLGIRGFLERIAAQARVSASILEALRARPAGGAALDGRLRAIIGAVLARGEADPSVTVDDVATATSMVALHVALQPDDARAAERAVDLAVRALAPGAGR